MDLYVSQLFDSLEAVKLAAEANARVNRWTTCIKKRDSTRIVISCRSSRERPCPFHLRASWDPVKLTARIVSLENVHDCIGSTPPKRAEQSKIRYLRETVPRYITVTRQTPTKDIQDVVEAHCGGPIDTEQAQRLRRDLCRGQPATKKTFRLSRTTFSPAPASSPGINQLRPGTLTSSATEDPPAFEHSPGTGILEAAQAPAFSNIHPLFIQATPAAPNTAFPSIPAMADADQPESITIIGAGTIGLSFAALHLTNTNYHVTIYDTRPDLTSYIDRTLPKLLAPSSSSQWSLLSRLHLSTSLATACCTATIIQECLPENPTLKISLWAEIETLAPPNTLLWSATSGIPASVQVANMRDKTRLLVGKLEDSIQRNHSPSTQTVSDTDNQFTLTTPPPSCPSSKSSPPPSLTLPWWTAPSPTGEPSAAVLS